MARAVQPSAPRIFDPLFDESPVAASQRIRAYSHVPPPDTP